MAVPGKAAARIAAILESDWGRVGHQGVGPRSLAQLEVNGRVTGNPVLFPVVVADYQGERYLVSMLGEDTNWVPTFAPPAAMRCFATVVGNQ